MNRLMGDSTNRARSESGHEGRIQSSNESRGQTKNDTRRFVTFALGANRFALDSSQVKEVVMPSRVYWFPHTMPSLEGVLVRRGTAIPVCNLSRAFGEGGPRSLYVITQCSYAGAVHAVAIPVSGACELVQGEPWEETDAAPAAAVTFVAGLLRTAGGTVPLLNMDQVVAHCMQGSSAMPREARQ
jgi:chemotaxis signal transduction protein